MLDPLRPAHRASRATAGLLAPGRVPDPAGRGDGQRPAWDGHRVPGKELAAHDRGGGVASASGGRTRRDIGPVPVTAGEQYSALFMEAIFTPGMTSALHSHSGPEAWYTVAGETCLETPGGKFVGRAGGPPVIVPRGHAHPSRIVEASNHRDPRMEAQGIV